MDEDEVQPPLKGLSHLKTINKYARIVKVLQTVGCRFKSVSGDFCDCPMYLKSFGHCELFDELAKSDDVDSVVTNDKESIARQYDCLRRVQCRRCHHSAEDHLKMLADPFDENETIEMIMLGSDLNRIKNFVDWEKEPIANQVYEHVYGVYVQLMYTGPVPRKLYPYSMDKHYPSPPFEHPSIEYYVYNLVYYFHKPNTAEMNKAVKCGKYFLQQLNNWELPRLDSQFYQSMAPRDQPLYKAFFQLWLVYCYVPSVNAILKKYSLTRIFGIRLFSMIYSIFLDHFREHLDKLADRVITDNFFTELDLSPSDFDTFLTRVSSHLTSFSDHLVHSNYINALFVADHGLKLCNSPLFFEQFQVQLKGICFVKWPEPDHPANSQARVQDFLLDIDQGAVVDLFKLQKRRAKAKAKAMANATNHHPLTATALTNGYHCNGNHQYTITSNGMTTQQLTNGYGSVSESSDEEAKRLEELKERLNDKFRNRSVEEDKSCLLRKLLNSDQNKIEIDSNSDPDKSKSLSESTKKPIQVQESTPSNNSEVAIKTNEDSNSSSEAKINLSLPLLNGKPLANRTVPFNEQYSQQIQLSGLTFQKVDSKYFFFRRTQPDPNLDKTQRKKWLNLASLKISTELKSKTKTKKTSGKTSKEQSLAPPLLNGDMDHLLQPGTSKGEINRNLSSNLPSISLHNGPRVCTNHSNLAKKNPNIAALLSGNDRVKSPSHHVPLSLSMPSTSSSIVGEHSAVTQSAPLSQVSPIKIQISPVSSNGSEKSGINGTINSILCQYLLSPTQKQEPPKTPVSPNNHNGINLMNTLNRAVNINPKRSVSPNNSPPYSLVRNPLGSPTFMSPVRSPTPNGAQNGFRQCTCSPSKYSPTSQRTLANGEHCAVTHNSKHAITPTKTPPSCNPNPPSPNAANTPPHLSQSKADSNDLSEQHTAASAVSGKRAKKRPASPRHSLPRKYKLKNDTHCSNGHPILNGECRNSGDSSSASTFFRAKSSLLGIATSPSISRRLFSASPVRLMASNAGGNSSNSPPDSPIRSPGKGRSTQSRRVARTINLRHRKVVLPKHLLLPSLSAGSPTANSQQGNSPSKNRKSGSPVRPTSNLSVTANGHFHQIKSPDRLSDATVIMSDQEETVDQEEEIEYINGSTLAKLNKPSNNNINNQQPSESSSYGDPNSENDLYGNIKSCHLYVDNLEVFRNKTLHDEVSKRKILLFLELQNVISNQLPNMGYDYINNLIFKPGNRSILLIKNKRVIGGFTFRMFPEHGFTEIIFCAITSREQVKGYGSIMMNLVKEYCARMGIHRLLTYADNFALEFFRKKGFTTNITVLPEEYEDKITLCVGAHLMECRLDANFKCPDSYDAIYLREWLEKEENPLSPSDSPLIENNNRRTDSPRKTSSRKAMLDTTSDADASPQPKKRGRKPKKPLPKLPLIPAVMREPPKVAWKEVDAFVKLFGAQTGTFIFRKENRKVTSRYQYAVCFDQIRRLHNQKRHYRTVRMLYYDLLIMLRGFQYTFKKNSSAFKTALRLERFLKKKFKEIFDVEEFL